MKRSSVALAVLCLAFGGACDGKKWPASMAQQPSVGPLEGPRKAPEGSVAVGTVDLVEAREDLEDATNPFANDPQAAARGARLFRLYCIACHGPEGRGDGKVSDKMPQAPDVRHQSICRRTDGFIYGTITLGGKAMPSLREGTTSRDRWELVSFVRSLQREGCTGSSSGNAPEGEAGPSDAPAAAGEQPAPKGEEAKP